MAAVSFASPARPATTARYLKSARCNAGFYTSTRNEVSARNHRIPSALMTWLAQSRQPEEFDVADPTQTHNPQSMAVELALLALLATLWGASYTFIKLGVATIPPITLIAARTGIAGLLLVAIMRWRGLGLPSDAATWRRFLFQACLNSVIPWTLIAWGERLVDAGLATILNSASPIFTFLLATAVTRHEVAGFRKLFGVLAGMAGICLIVGVEAFHDAGGA